MSDTLYHDRLAVDLSLLIVRVTAGVVFAFHGAQKMFGWFGGMGLDAMMEEMGDVLGFLVSFGEFFGGLGLIVGLLCRFSAASLILIMLGAIAMVHGQNGFSLEHQGFEYNFALIGLMLPTLIAGAGKYAAGRFLPLPKVQGTDRPILVLE